MDDEKMELPKETIGSVAATRTEFAKLYASMNAEQIARMLQPLEKIAKVVNDPTNKSIQAAASSMAKTFINPIQIGTNKTLIDAAGTLTKSYTDAMKVANIPFDSISSMSATLQAFLKNFQSTIFKDLSNFTKILETTTTHTEEEIKDIQYKLNILAERCWVVYFLDYDLFYDVKIDDFEEVEEYWFELLESDLEDKNIITKLEQSQFIPSVLTQSMVQSYQSENYYAAYTVAAIIIDGALNRFAEAGSNTGNKLKVGYKAVDFLDSEFTNQSLRDSGFIEWLKLFFADTKNFTLERPNRHMINHGRWEGQISKNDFLKIFNAVLYVEDVLSNRISYV